MTEKPTRTYQLDVSRIDGIEDIKKILDGLQLRINTDDVLYEDVKHLFTAEVVPEGYIRLLKELGEEEIAKMTYEEMREKISTLPDEETN